MGRWYERANEASFKRTSEGYVFQAPSPWAFARPRYYLVNEEQKAQLLVGLGRWRLTLLIASLLNMSLIISLTLLTHLWPGTFARPLASLFREFGATGFAVLLFTLLMLLMTPLIVFAQRGLACVLRVTLAGAPPTDERITIHEQLPKIAGSVSRIVLALGLIGGTGLLTGAVLQMFDGYREGHLLPAAVPSVLAMLAGGLLIAYFTCLARLKTKQG
jgi:hypothetical protein